MAIIEYYCPSKKPMWEHDKECYYHGQLKQCPICGTLTKEVRQAEYIPLKVEGLGDVTPSSYVYAHESEIPVNHPYWDSET